MSRKPLSITTAWLDREQRAGYHFFKQERGLVVYVGKNRVTKSFIHQRDGRA